LLDIQEARNRGITQARSNAKTQAAWWEFDQFIFGEGGYTLKYGASMFPDTICWLGEDYFKGG